MLDFKKISEIIDKETRALVGRLCKRVEVLEKEKSLSPTLYKALSKELVYEFSRDLKKLIDIQSELFKLEFKIKPNKSIGSE